MDTMAIAAMSMEMSAAKLSQGVSVALLKKTMDAQQTQAAQLLQAMEQPAPVDPARLLDITV